MKSFIFFFLAAVTVSAQEQYPKDYFIAPLDIPLFLSGSFGELRSNHFHSGVDFKTQSKTGFTVFATADGYISRIKISTFGYGKAVYITHPNGFTSVYGHLLTTSPKIDGYLKKKQYELQSFEVDLFPSQDELVVKQGEIIALSGNTGGSGGPHLHFEYRDTKTEKIINPLYFGLADKIKDTKNPVVNEVVIYPLTEESIVNNSQIPLSIPFSLQKDGTYLASKVKVTGKVGVGVNTIDGSDNNYSKNGIYQMDSFLDGKPSFQFKLNTFSYDETRYINAFIDYGRFKKMNQRVQKMFFTKKYPLSIVSSNDKNGVINLAPNMSSIYKVEISDFHNNKTSVTIPLEYAKQEIKIPSKNLKTNYFVKSTQEYNFVKDKVTVYFPENIFYDDFYLKFDVKNSTLYLHDESVPVHANFSVSFENDSIPEQESDKYFIGNLDGKKVYYNKTKRKGNKFTAWTRNFGQFSLMKDTVAPKLIAVNFQEGKWLSKQNTLEFEISDDLSGIDTYEGFLNKKWILFDYDYKSKKIIHDFSDNVVIEGKNELKLVVTDNVGNSTIFESHFFRSQKP
jgi:hypothetical protein